MLAAILSEHPYIGLKLMHIIMYKIYPQKILYSRSFYVSCIFGGLHFLWQRSSLVIAAKTPELALF